MPFYHGTTQKSWEQQKDINDVLFLTQDLKDALNYAYEAGESEWDDDIHEKNGLTPTPIVVFFTEKSLRKLKNEEKLSFEPDWGWVDGLEHEMKQKKKLLNKIPTWQESLKKVGSFGIRGVLEKHKSLGNIQSADDMVQEILKIAGGMKP